MILRRLRAADVGRPGEHLQRAHLAEGPFERRQRHPDVAIERGAAGRSLPRLDPDDAARLLISPVPELAPGTYEVRWTSVTDDGHVERDTWAFTVTAAPTPTPSPTPSPTAEPTASATPAPTATPEPSPTVAPSPSADVGDQAGDSGDVLLPIVIALAVVGFVAGYLVSRRGRTAPRA